MFEMSLISPYGGELVSLMVSPEERMHVSRRAAALPSVQLTPESAAELELLATGGYSPLRRFMGSEDYGNVADYGRLASGLFFPAPVLLPIRNPGAYRPGQEIALRDAKNNLIAWMGIEEIFETCHVSGELKVLDLPQ